ncbi:ABC transporter permease [Paenibacillus hamazuiensis]|uniref:ABC transporter permease n=1 Tax=Paenibacillus hamazuiensis TaxID=2936508 RepID=UPI00200FED6D|nr:ABC-2 family transporter protein [Paenibacillus hamazuiensis]
MLFFTLVKKAYARNLQYRASHAINTFASIVFGLVYVCIWRGIGENQPLGAYGLQGIVHYVAFNQVCLFITTFLTNGLGLQQSVRTGQISLELMRPVHLFYQLMAKEWGQIGYQALYKSLPIYLVYAAMFSMPVPANPIRWLETLAALALAAYISICINYLIGVAALWTTESGWLHWTNISMSMVFSGYLIPVEWLPGPFRDISRFSPYPYIQYYPTKIFLGMEHADVLPGSLLWCAVFTALCLLFTAMVRSKVEVQGG